MSWCVYCLYFGNKKTYVGATVNFSRRIRQHNTELVGGAKYTTNAKKKFSNQDWKPLFIVHNFPHQRSALQFEWALKRESLKFKRGYTLKERRIKAVESLMTKTRVTRQAEPLASWNLTIQYYDIHSNGGSSETEGIDTIEGGNTTFTYV